MDTEETLENRSDSQVPVLVDTFQIEKTDQLKCAKALLMDPTRAKHLDLLDIQPSEAAPEIGSSMGRHTRRIAAGSFKLARSLGPTMSEK